jgi:hypothetical protein
MAADALPRWVRNGGLEYADSRDAPAAAREIIMKRSVPLFVTALLLVGCSQAAASPSAQVPIPEEFLGEFLCSGHEGGLLAMAGALRISRDGVAAVEWMSIPQPVEGTWGYDAANGRMLFSENLEISHAEYDSSVNQLAVYLAQGVERAHVEMGVMYCQQQ